MSTPAKRRSGCPVVFALDLFGDRWTLLIVRDLALRGMTTYGEFLEAGEGISTNILADRLKRLQDQKIVTRSSDPAHGAKYRYKLTKKGLALIPVMVEMMRWSASHDARTPMSAAFKRRLDREPRRIAEEFAKRARGTLPDRA